MIEFGIRWLELNKQGELVMKEKIFKTEEARDKFVEELEERDNFCEIDSWLN